MPVIADIQPQGRQNAVHHFQINIIPEIIRNDIDWKWCTISCWIYILNDKQFLVYFVGKFVAWQISHHARYWSIIMHDTAECRYNAVQYYKIYIYTSPQWWGQNKN